ncbi:MAG: hypothetical protein COA71_09395 [SAR86 cluster bacterium]|uniref:histidine kinase n=1 Tax=SAR86 cluster bacterium TaxID=2030880 RepID=A0A2A5CBB1_9GAMM|nr:MAG: hypothetical protein COA71_09395 [SAR86 cluster bacterium]
MYIQQYLNNQNFSAISPITTDPESLQDLSLLQAIFNSLDIGIGLVSENNSILYNNVTLGELLKPLSTVLPEENIFVILGLKENKISDIHRLLTRNESWEGIVTKFGKDLKITLSPLNFVTPRSIDHMSDAKFIITIADHSEIIKQRKILSQAKESAERSNKSKSEFLSHMTHELRTPLNAVLGFTEVLNSDPNIVDDNRDSLNEIISASNHLLCLINEILDMSRIEHGELKLFCEKINTSELISECISLVKPLANKKNIQLLQQPSAVSLIKDRVRLKQVLLNLLSNAIKYNKSNGQVLVNTSKPSPTKIQIEIIDSGKGMPSEMLSTIFNPFERLGIEDRQVEGTGIGLMITRQLVKLMGGNISVISEPKCGSVFTVEFPVIADSHSGKLSAHAQTNVRPGKILWLGEGSESINFAKRLTELRPNFEFEQTQNIDLAIQIIKQNSPDIFLIADEYLLRIKEKLSSFNKNFLKDIPSIVVVFNKPLINEVSAEGFNITTHLPLPLNAIDYLGLLDNDFIEK